MDRQLSLEFARITEQAALKSARLVGLGDKEGADQAAVDGMHEQFALTPVSGTVARVRLMKPPCCTLVNM